MRIAIIGYGKMGRLIAEMAESRRHEISHKINSQNAELIDDLTDTDLAIEFSNPDVVLNNIETLLSQKIPVLVGTTGWQDQLGEVHQWVDRFGSKLFYASNFSIGVYLSIQTSNFLAGLMSGRSGYNATVEEWHHMHKKDAPSGTALSIADGIIDHHARYNASALAAENLPGATLPITAYREGEIFGTHEVNYSSAIDRITIRHEAKNRNGFAQGAIEAGEFLINQPSGVYTMKHLFNL